MNPVFQNVQKMERTRNKRERKVAVEDDKRMDLVMKIRKRASGHKAGKVIIMLAHLGPSR